MVKKEGKAEKENKTKQKSARGQTERLAYTNIISLVAIYTRVSKYEVKCKTSSARSNARTSSREVKLSRLVGWLLLISVSVCCADIKI